VRVAAEWDEYALVLIDVQADFWPETLATAFPDFPAATGSLLAAARERGIDVVHVHALFQPDGTDWMARYRLRGRIPCVAGTPGAETLPFAAPVPGERVVVKQTFDAFLGTDLDAALRAAGKRFLLMAGLVTSTCVLFTAASATQRGYLVAVVEDCCADGPGSHERVLDEYPFLFSRTRSSRLTEDRDDWEYQLRGLARLG
jgi:nicotinamidase-related amidase